MKKLFLLILLAVTCAVSAAAQKVTVESFGEAGMDLTAQKYARKDLNGVKCAVVKVQIVGDGVDFQGNVIGDVEAHGSEYWVYMASGTKMVKIIGRSFLPLMYDFPEPLKSGVTYVLTLEAPQPAGTAAPQRKKQNFLALQVTPVSAHVTVDGAELPLENGIASKLLPAGTHTFRVTATGYAPHEETVTIADQKVMRTIALRSVKPRLTVTTTTPGTEIFINEISRGTDRWNGELYADTYVVEGRLSGHRPNSQTVTLVEDQSRTVTIPALTPITGTLSVDYKPFDATVTIDDRAAGTTPLLLDNILVGTHRVTISKDGYTPATLSATVTESSPATLSGTLTAAPSYTGPTPADVALTNKYKKFEMQGKYGYKHNGRVVIPAKFDNTWCFGNGLAPVKIDDKWGVIDKNGILVIPAKYEDAWYFTEGLAPVKINGKWGFIDTKDHFVIPPIFEDAWNFGEGLAPVKTNGKWGFIDPSGKFVLQPIYDEPVGQTFFNGKAKVKLNGREFYIDRNGNEVQ